MIKIIIYSFLLLSLFNCKKEKNTIKRNIDQEMLEKEKTTIQDSIRVFTVSFNSKYIIETKIISKLVEQLQNDYIEYPLSESQLKNEIKRKKSQSFIKILARDFQNNQIRDVLAVNYTFVQPKVKNDIKILIEEWTFENKEIAKSCFDSFKKYREMEIYLKTVNLIWIRQGSKLFFIYSFDTGVKSKEMQNIKKELIKIIAKQGKYEAIQFYE